MGPRGGDDAARAASVLHRLSEDGGTVRRVRGGLPVAVRKPQRAQEAGRAGHGDAGDAGRGQALRSHRGGARGRCAAGVARHDESRQRGCDPAGVQGDRRGRRRGLAAQSSGVLRRTAARRTVDPRCRYDDQAALRPSGRGGSRLQSEETRTSEPLLSHLFDGLDAAGFRRRRLSRRRAYVQAQRAGPVGVPRPPAARPVAGAAARRRRFRQRRRHARGGGAETSLSLQAAPDPERPAHDREALRRASGSARVRGSGPRRARFACKAGAASGAPSCSGAV